MKLKNTLLVLSLGMAGLIMSCNDDDDSSDPVVTDPCLNVNLDACETCTVVDGKADVQDTCTTEQTGSIEVTKTGLIAANETWSADSIYLLSNKVIVGSGVTLTIEPGTIIKGKEGLRSLASALIVARGGTLMAEGNAEKPIIFTSEQDNIQPGQTAGTNLDENDNGLWGGLIILGNAPISASGGAEAQIEGIPADEDFGKYGGSDSTDNSGVLKYVSVRHGGIEIGDGNEINGITFGGVGNGTTVDHIEVVANKDDGIEFFGGSVNVTNAIVWAADDDGYDVDQSYSGTIDNFVFVGFGGSDHAFEIDGPESDVNNMGAFTFRNGTIKGFDGTNCGQMVDFRDGALGLIEDCYFYNFCGDANIEIDEEMGIANWEANNLDLLTSEFTIMVDSIEIIFEVPGFPEKDSLFKVYGAENNTMVAADASTKGANTEALNWSYAASKSAF